MGLFYNLSDTEILNIRNKIFLEKGRPKLIENGFEKSPYTTAWHGKDDLGDYCYEFCKLSKESLLEVISVEIVRGDRWIRVFLNIFELQPKLNSLEKLLGTDGLQFYLPPNSLTRMRLRVDDFKGMPLLRFKEHKIASFYSEKGFNKRINQLGSLIEKDMDNIDFFVKNWQELHNKPLITDWSGVPL